MIKTIKINREQSVTLNSAAGWFFVYREQFGRDILPDIMPMLEGILTAGINALKNVEGSKVTLDAIDNDVLTDFFINISGLESITILQIIWAMAKTADSEIEPPEVWFNQFDVFPLDQLIPKVLRLVVESSVSSKNAKRLLNLLKETAGSLSNSSPSQESTEG